MAANQPDARTALATRAEAQVATQPPTTAQRIMALESQFQMAMPKGMEAKRLIRDALTCLRTVRDLDRCDGDSVLGALMTCAQLGLRPGVLGHAWPLPFWDGRTQGMRAQLVIGYQGYIELGHRSGQILSLIARTAHENDLFDVDYGLADSLVHKPNLRGERGAPIAYYAIAKFIGGGHAFIVMTQTEMLAHMAAYAPRDKSKAITGPWVKHFEAQALKTVIRRLAKYMPKSTDPMAEALAADGGVRVDLSPTAPPSDVTGLPPMWDGDVVDHTPEPAQAPPPQPEPPTETEPARDPGLASDAQIKAVQTLRNKLDGFKGNGAEARELFLVHVASVIGREVASTTELTVAEASSLIDDLQRAIKADKEREKANPSVAEVAAQQSATLRTMRGDGPAATEEEAGF